MGATGPRTLHTSEACSWLLNGSGGVCAWERGQARANRHTCAHEGLVHDTQVGVDELHGGSGEGLHAGVRG